MNSEAQILAQPEVWVWFAGTEMTRFTFNKLSCYDHSCRMQLILFPISVSLCLSVSFSLSPAFSFPASVGS